MESDCARKQVNKFAFPSPGICWLGPIGRVRHPGASSWNYRAIPALCFVAAPSRRLRVVCHLCAIPALEPWTWKALSQCWAQPLLEDGEAELACKALPGCLGGCWSMCWYVCYVILCYVTLCCVVVCRHACLRICMHVSMHAWMYACMCLRMFVCMYDCMIVWLYDCMYVCMYVCMYDCMIVWLCDCVIVWLCVCMYDCMIVWLYDCMIVWLYVCMIVWLYVCMYACMHVCMCVCMHVCLYVIATHKLYLAYIILGIVGVLDTKYSKLPSCISLSSFKLHKFISYAPRPGLSMPPTQSYIIEKYVIP